MAKNFFFSILDLPWKKIVGALCIVVGIIGLFLPFIQGILLIIIGLGILGDHRIIDWFKKKFNIKEKTKK